MNHTTHFKKNDSSTHQNDWTNYYLKSFATAWVNWETYQREEKTFSFVQRATRKINSIS